MAFKYMLDTNIASFIIKNHSKTLDSRIRFIPIHKMCISAVTRAELRYGVVKKGNNDRLAKSVDDFLTQMNVLDWDIMASERYAFVRSDLEANGNVIGNMDMLIASHALATDLTLITNNTKEFSRVIGLFIEDWTKE